MLFTLDDKGGGVVVVVVAVAAAAAAAAVVVAAAVMVRMRALQFNVDFSSQCGPGIIYIQFWLYLRQGMGRGENLHCLL
jgi:hypothetical protein